SFPPTTLAQEIAQRYDRGSAELHQFIEHYSKRAQLEDSLATTIEKTGGWFKHGMPRGGSSSSTSAAANAASANASGLVPMLQGEVEMRARMHLHLAERINNEVVRPLESFFRAEAWKAALGIRNRVHGMAEEMRNHHEQIPKLSARVASKAARSTQLQQRLEDEKHKLFGLQQLWQTDIAGLVDDFEAADIARIEVLRESVLRFQHYQSEFFKAAQGQTVAAKEAAKQLQAGTRIVDALTRPGSGGGGDTHRDGPGPQRVGRSASASDAEDKPGGKGFLKLGLFRSKTRRVKKKSSATSQSMASSDVSSQPAGSGSIVTPDVGSSAGVPSVRTVHSHDTEGLSPGIAEPHSSVTVPRALGRQGSSFASASSAHRSDSASEAVGVPKPATLGQQSTSTQESAGDFAEWVFAGHSQEGSGAKPEGGLSADSLVHVTHSLSVIDESPTKSREARPADEPAEQIVELPTKHAAEEPIDQVVDQFIEQVSEQPAEQSADGEQPVQQTAKVPVDPAFGTIANVEGPAANSAWPEVAETTNKQSDSTHAAGDSLRFDDVFTQLEIPAKQEKAEPAQAVIDASLGSPTIDLDSAFSVPPAKPPASAALDSPRALSPPAASKGHGHRRNSSMHTKGSPSFDGKKPEDSDDTDEVEQTFRVNFSIRERAIQDNPDESKAALSRVATMLRSAPSSRRRNRREVRTMYISTGEATPSLDAAPTEGSAGTESVEPEPLTPMPQRPEAQEVTLDMAAPEVAPVPAPEPTDANDEPEESTAEAAIPVATATALDAQAAVVDDENGVPTNDGMTVEPVSNKSEPAETASVTATVEPENGLDPEPGTAAKTTLPENEAESLPKTEGSVRRRAPPPPPPAPAQSVSAPVVRARSLRQPSHASLAPTAETTAAAVEAPMDSAAAEPAQSASPDGSAASEAADAKSASYRARRGGASNRPLALTMQVNETLDFSMQSQGHELPRMEHKVTGEVTLHVGGKIAPLELAPLRICVQRAADVQWVANPSVVTLDASLTASDGDSRQWYRFVRPDLFAQADALDAAVFKYQASGRDDPRVLPLLVREVTKCADGMCALMLFCEPNVDGLLAGSTVHSSALLLNVEGTVATQASRPAATWFKERNRLLWTLESMQVPRSGQLSEDEVLRLSKTLAIKMTGTDLRPGSLALRFEIHNAQLVDIPVSIMRVAAAGTQAAVPVVAGPAEHSVKSGKCIYTFFNEPSPAAAEQSEHGSSSEAWSDDNNNSE
ncbi:hypothetical protein IWW54_001818, partial [Coemansia sp. RSA 2705]